MKIEPQKQGRPALVSLGDTKQIDSIAYLGKQKGGRLTRAQDCAPRGFGLFCWAFGVFRTTKSRLCHAWIAAWRRICAFFRLGAGGGTGFCGDPASVDGLQLTGNIVNGFIVFLPGVVSRREVWLSKVRGEVQSANKMRQAGFSFLRLFDRLLYPLKKFLKIVRGADPQGGFHNAMVLVRKPHLNTTKAAPRLLF